MPHSSRLIRDMPPQTSPGEIKPGHGEAKKVHGRKRIPSHILGLRSIPKKTVTMDWSENSRLLLHHSTIARLISQKKVKWSTGTRGISVLNLLDSMQRWNEEYGITLSVSGISSETNGFQKSDLRVSDHTRSSRPYSNQLIPWWRQLSGSMQKWFLLPSVSISG